MIVDRYNSMDLFEMVPKLNLDMQPELAELDVLLDDDVLFARVKADLSLRAAPIRRGSSGIPRP